MLGAAASVLVGFSVRVRAGAMVQCALCHRMRALEHGALHCGWLGARSARPLSTLTGDADGLSAEGASLDEEAVTSLGDDGSIRKIRNAFGETAARDIDSIPSDKQAVVSKSATNRLRLFTFLQRSQPPQKPNTATAWTF